MKGEKRGKKVEYFYGAYKNESQRNLLLHMGTKERGYVRNERERESLKWKNIFFLFSQKYISQYLSAFEPISTVSSTE